MNVKKERRKKKKKKSGDDGIGFWVMERRRRRRRFWDIWIKYLSPYRLRYVSWLKLSHKEISIAIFTKVELSTMPF
jgi:hypothetical protein